MQLNKLSFVLTFFLISRLNCIPAWITAPYSLSLSFLSAVSFLQPHAHSSLVYLVSLLGNMDHSFHHTLLLVIRALTDRYPSLLGGCGKDIYRMSNSFTAIARLLGRRLEESTAVHCRSERSCAEVDKSVTVHALFPTQAVLFLYLFFFTFVCTPIQNIKVILKSGTYLHKKTLITFSHILLQIKDVLF